jgi:hypothetical protein
MRSHTKEQFADLSFEREFISDFDDYVSSRDLFQYCFDENLS